MYVIPSNHKLIALGRRAEVNIKEGVSRVIQYTKTSYREQNS